MSRHRLEAGGTGRGAGGGDGNRVQAGTGFWPKEPPPLPFSCTEDDFGRIRALIYRHAGIALSPGKKDLVYSRLSRRLRALGLDSFSEYLKLLDEGKGAEFEEFINALTTNMTSFFREPHHFPILATHLARLAGRRISIWTCASSTGEEPYSIAMTALESCGASAAVRILATDVDTRVLAQAERGIYPLDQLGKLTDQRLRRFFLRGERQHEGMVRVREELKRLVTFRRLNLLDPSWPLKGRFDAIFCRNVLIYFDKETQQTVLSRLARSLQPDGLLFLGHSESFHHASGPFRLCGNTVYTLRSGAADTD